MGLPTKITKCRMCGNANLIQVVDLGSQYLSGVFPKDKQSLNITCGPLRLVKCHGGEDVCGLLQLDRTFDLQEMYGDNYGYRSGLNLQMVEHLSAKIAAIQEKTSLQPGDLVIDIGANDGTSLGSYSEDLLLVGVDPTGEKFRQYYKEHIQLIPDFFSAGLIRDVFPDKKAKVVTSFSMLYDLEDPVAFAKDIALILDPSDGIWVFEQSYMPLMIERMSFDTICHEHLEYYGLKQIVWLAEQADLKILDVDLNDVNGGSFSVIAAPKSSRWQVNSEKIAGLLSAEKQAQFDELRPYRQFYEDLKSTREELIQFVSCAHAEGRTVAALGASTKGNILLQYCGFTESDISAVGDVNPEKYGAVTPGTWIPIKEEKQVLEQKFDYLIVLPWHFKEFFLSNKAFVGQNLVFLLPKLEVVAR
jgi:hypothetical protein